MSSTTKQRKIEKSEPNSTQNNNSSKQRTSNLPKSTNSLASDDQDQRTSTSSFVALLRGINISGTKIMKMAELKHTLETDAKLASVKTYIQSGNLVFSLANTDPRLASADPESNLAREIERAIEKRWGYDVPTFVFSQQDWLAIQTNNPFLKKKDSSETNLKRLYVCFLTCSPGPTAANKFEMLKTASAQGDDYVVSGSRIFLSLQSYGRSKLNNTEFEKATKDKATTRNWNTILTLSNLFPNKN